jgi:hypothetical protein
MCWGTEGSGAQEYTMQRRRGRKAYYEPSFISCACIYAVDEDLNHGLLPLLYLIRANPTIRDIQQFLYQRLVSIMFDNLSMYAMLDDLYCEFRKSFHHRREGLESWQEMSVAYPGGIEFSGVCHRRHL